MRDNCVLSDLSRTLWCCASLYLCFSERRHVVVVVFAHWFGGLSLRGQKPHHGFRHTIPWGCGTMQPTIQERVFSAQFGACRSTNTCGNGAGYSVSVSHDKGTCLRLACRSDSIRWLKFTEHTHCGGRFGSSRSLAISNIACHCDMANSERLNMASGPH